MTKEGKAVHSEYRIVLLPGNNLMMKATFVEDRYGYQRPGVPKAEGGYEAYKVDRVESGKPLTVAPKGKVPLPDDAVVPATKYWLRFRGWNNVLITYF